jgi:hypothetical protein
VGDYSDKAGVIGTDKTLILHWNGHSWSKVTSPDPGTPWSCAAARTADLAMLGHCPAVYS